MFRDAQYAKGRVSGWLCLGAQGSFSFLFVLFIFMYFGGVVWCV